MQCFQRLPFAVLILILAAPAFGQDMELNEAERDTLAQVRAAIAQQARAVQEIRGRWVQAEQGLTMARVNTNLLDHTLRELQFKTLAELRFRPSDCYVDGGKVYIRRDGDLALYTDVVAKAPRPYPIADVPAADADTLAKVEAIRVDAAANLEQIQRAVYEIRQAAELEQTRLSALEFHARELEAVFLADRGLTRKAYRIDGARIVRANPEGGGHE